MSQAKRYTLETLLPLNVSYDSDHGLTQEDVDMVNSLVEVIESTRSKHTPKIGDRVVYTQKGGEYHPHGLIEKKHEDNFYVCLDPFIPFVCVTSSPCPNPQDPLSGCQECAAP